MYATDSSQLLTNTVFATCTFQMHLCLCDYAYMNELHYVGWVVMNRAGTPMQRVSFAPVNCVALQRH